MPESIALQTAAAAAPATTAAAHHDRARTDTLVLLFDQSFPALYQSFIVGSVLCWTLWGHVDAQKLLIWLGLLGASSLLRLGMYVLYFRAKPTGPAVLAWERPYAATLMVSSLIWGLGMLWLMPPDDVAGQFVILFFVAGLMGGAIVAYSAHRGMTIAAMAAVLVPSTVWLFFQPGQISLGMAVAASTFMLGALRGTHVLSSAMQTRLQLSYELERTNAEADRMARTDELTSINNRRAFMELGEQTSRLCHRQGKPLSALLMDVDHFKKINDTHGHSAGDAVLTQLGALLAQQFRAADVCGRIGGEEFAVLLANTDTATAAVLAEKLRQAVAEVSIPWEGRVLRVTTSIGVATHGGHLGTLLQRADAAMYQAKASGRNRVVCAEEPGHVPLRTPV